MYNSSKVTKIKTIAFQGLDVSYVDVQVQICSGMPVFNIVGLPDKSVAESRDRIRSSLVSIGLTLPVRRVIVNLAPSDLAKEGSYFDLPIAVGILVNMGVIPSDEITEYLILGELALDGTIMPVCGMLPAALFASTNNIGIICPEPNGIEASWVENIKVIAAPDLLSLVNHFKGVQIIDQPQISSRAKNNRDALEPSGIDFKDIYGQELAKRAMMIAAAGRHNVLLIGPPGTGKSMLANRLRDVLPKMTATEILECSILSSIIGGIKNGNLITHRPFRAPHHSCSMAAMVGGGGGNKIRPGEVSLAHNGVLFLDELPEFARNVLDALRQPIETHSVLIARAKSHVTYPAKFQLVAAMNYCQCGYLYDPNKACSRAPKCAEIYMGKVSGPILDRFDLKIEVGQVDLPTLDSAGKGDNRQQQGSLTTKMMGNQINKALDFKENNRQIMKIDEMIDNLKLDSRKFLDMSIKKLRISMRSYHKLVLVARTIADLDLEADILPEHIAEALNYTRYEILKA